ncbi:MAG: hypothetical protein V4550_03420 [Gemmatimonadota bacterium]
MALLVLVVLGFALGRWLGTSRMGFLTLAMVSVGSTVVQIIHLATTADRSRMTMLPIVVGALLAVGLLFGAFTRRVPQLSTGG